VEHPVTEMVTGVDLVEWQLRVAAGERLPLLQSSLQLAPRAHSIEARIYAENPECGFLPGSGHLTHLKTCPEEGDTYSPAFEPCVRLDMGVREGDEISVHYDPMIAKLIVRDVDRRSALRKLDLALKEWEVGGVPTNVGFIRRVLNTKPFRDGEVHTGFIGELESELLPPTPDPSLIPLFSSFAALHWLKRSAGASLSAGGLPSEKEKRKQTTAPFRTSPTSSLQHPLSTSTSAQESTPSVYNCLSSASSVLVQPLGFGGEDMGPAFLLKLDQLEPADAEPVSGGAATSQERYHCTVQTVQHQTPLTPAGTTTSRLTLLSHSFTGGLTGVTGQDDKHARISAVVEKEGRSERREASVALLSDPAGDALSTGDSSVDPLGSEMKVFSGGEEMSFRLLGGWEAAAQRVRALVGSAGGEQKAGGGKGAVVAPMPGKISRLLVAEGEAVSAGQGLVVMEAMKMEHTLSAKSDGTVGAVSVGEGDVVPQRKVLLEIE